MRLTNQMREDIIKGFITEKFNGRIEKIERAMEEEALSIFNKITSDDKEMQFVKENSHKMTNFLPTHKKLYIELIRTNNSDRYNLTLYLPKYIVVPIKVQQGTPLCKMSLDSEILSKYLKLEKDLNSLDKERDKTRSRVKKLLNNFTTDTKLINEWPEVKKFLQVNETLKTPPVCILKDEIEMLNNINIS